MKLGRRVYFPDTRVASDGELVSPISYAGHGPVNAPNDASPGFVPAGGDSPWIVPVPSDEQGLGRSPGQQWPGRVHAETYNFDQIAVMPFEHEQTAGMPAGEGYGETGREHTGLVGFMPGGDGGYLVTEPLQFPLWPHDSVISLDDPQSAAYTIASGSLPTGPDAGAGGYGFE